MPVRVTCPHCQQKLRLPEYLYDGPAQCPRCAGAFAIEWTARVRHEVPSTDSGVEPRRPCRFCGKPVLLQATKCPVCGEQLGE